MRRAKLAELQQCRLKEEEAAEQRRQKLKRDEDRVTEMQDALDLCGATILQEELRYQEQRLVCLLT